MARGKTISTPVNLPERWISPTEAALVIGCSREKLRRWREEGKIKAGVMSNGRWAYPESEIIRLSQPKYR